jgi:hypothetical protein
LIVAKVGLQSRPPPAREGKPFKTFSEVIRYILEHEGPLSLFKGIGPQITKGLLVQGILMMTKERYVSLVGFRNTYLRRNRTELLFIVLFRSFRKLRDEKLAKLAAAAAEKAKAASPVLLK